MLFADTLALALVSQIDVQILALMGGVRLTAAESVLAATKLFVSFFGMLSWPIWLIGTLVMACGGAPNWTWELSLKGPSQPVSRSLWSLAAVAVAAWVFVLPWTQREQQLRGTIERNFRAGQFHEVLTAMSAHQRDEFPPHWDPPPRIGAKRERPLILKVMQTMSPQTAPWVRDLYFNKFEAALGGGYEPQATLWIEADPLEILSVLESHPEGDGIMRRLRMSIWNLKSERGISNEAKQKINATTLRLIEPPELEGDSRNHKWPEEYTTSWYEYLTRLQTMERPWPKMAVRVARLRKLLEAPQFVPQDLQDLVRKVLAETTNTPLP